MDIRIGRVRSIDDAERVGHFIVDLLGEDRSDIGEQVTYTTPSFQIPNPSTEANKFTGFVGVPGVGTYVIVCQTPDDNIWYYLTSITGSANYTNLNEEFDKLGITGSSDEENYTSTFPFSETPEASPYSHKTQSQKYGIGSPKGGKMLISDSSNEEDLQYFTKLESQSGKMAMLDDVGDSVILKNEHGDGLKVTGHHYGEKVLVGPGPGPRSASLEADQNIFIEADSGSLNADVKGGYQLNIRNQTANLPIMRPISWDPKPGEVNVESTSNSINIKTHGHEYVLEPFKATVDEPKGVFIDASMFQGVVQIKAGRGGVEVWSQGDIDFNCAGSFNVNAGENINLNAASPLAGPYWVTQEPLNPSPRRGLIPPVIGLINLNNPVAYTLKPIPTMNNDQIYILRGGLLVPPGV